MELKVTDYKLPEQIGFNYEELKAWITAKADEYKMMVYTDDQIKQAKEDRASLNRLSKAMNDERIRLEKEYLEPFNHFKTQVNEIISIIKQPCAIIDSQIKEYEQKKADEKKEQITAVFNDMGFPEWLSLDRIFNTKWLNASTSFTSIKADLDAAMMKITAELDALADLPEYGFEAAEVYKRTLDITSAMAEAKRMSEIAKAKAEAEARRAADEERRKAEEEARKAAEAEQVEGQIEVTDTASFDKYVEDAIVKPVPEPRTWISFQAHLTAGEAQRLRAFFEENDIEFRPL